jgi:hypothetical protein
MPRYLPLSMKREEEGGGRVEERSQGVYLGRVLASWQAASLLVRTKEEVSGG